MNDFKNKMLELNNNSDNNVKTAKFQIGCPRDASSTSCSDISEDQDGPNIEDVIGDTPQEEISEKEGQPDVRRFRSMSDGAPITPNENGDVFEVFPSLPNSVLEKMGLFGDNPRERLSDDDVEQKFISLSLAFTIDAATIKDRCDRQRRHRDQTDTNLNKEIERLIVKVHRLQPLCVDADTTELLGALLSQVDIIIRATSLAATSAERFGAVQHEERLAESVQLMINHVNVLKQQRDSARRQLQYTKKVLQDTYSSETHTVRQRPLAHLANNRSMTKRRASIATISQPVPESPTRITLNDSRKMTRRTSELSLRGSVLNSRSRPSRLELGVDLVKIREGAMENIPIPVVDEEIDEDFEEMSSRKSSIDCSDKHIFNDTKVICTEEPIIVEEVIDVNALTLKDKLIYYLKKYGKYTEVFFVDLINNGSINEIFCFCALLCFSLGIITMGNIFVELENAKPGGGVFQWDWKFGNFWTNTRT